MAEEGHERLDIAIVETPRLLLRPLVPSDAGALAEALCDRDNMRFYPAPFSRADVDAWIEKCQWRYREHGHGLWALVLKDSGELTGDCGLLQQVVDGVTETEVGYHLARRFQGRGLATEAARACVNYGFERLRLTRIISLIRPENLPSRRVAERNGLVVERETLWAGLPHLIYVAARPSEMQP